MKKTVDVDLASWFAGMTPDKFSSLCERNGELNDADREEIKELTGILPPKGSVILLNKKDVDTLIENIKTSLRGGSR